MTGPAAEMAAAYTATGAAWQQGPGRIYDRLAEVLVAHLGPVAGERVLDLGAGTGAASRALATAGARVVALDVAVGMLTPDAATRPPAVAGDAARLPFASQAFDAVVAAFSLNHVTDPADALREAARVTRRSGKVVASAYAVDDTHPVKEAVDRAATEWGWSPPEWYREVRATAVPQLATTERFRAVAGAAGLAGQAEDVRVPFPDLGPAELIAWRLGLAQLAPFANRLTSEQRRGLTARAVELLGDPPPLVRSIVVLVAAVA